MSHFAKVIDGVVTEVIVAEQDFINSGAVGDSFLWKQTSYHDNFYGSFAGVGFTYDADKNVFIQPQPYPSWILDTNNRWEAPVAYPDDGIPRVWDESTQTWVEALD